MVPSLLSNKEYLVIFKVIKLSPNSNVEFG